MKTYGKRITIALVLLFVLTIGLLASRGFNQRNSAREDGLRRLRNGDHLLALGLLIQYGKEEDIPAIVPLLDDSNSHVRFSVARALGKLSGHEIPIPAGLHGNAKFSSSDTRTTFQAFDLSNEKLLAEYVAAWKAWATTYTSANKAPEATR